MVADAPTKTPQGSSSGARGIAPELTEAFDLVAAAVDNMAPRPALVLVASMRRRLDSIETTKAAELVTAAGDSRRAASAIGDSKTSRREKNRRARRAATAAKSKAVSDKVAQGDLSGEQVDLLGAADRRSDGAATDDADLIDRVAAMGADQSKAVIDNWLANRADPDHVEAEHERQRGLRSVRKHTNREGLGVITAEGDQVSIAEMFKTLMADANRLFEADGGRDLKRHPRSHSQRLFDSLHERICRGDGAPGRRRGGRGGSGAAGRAAVVITVDADRLTGRPGGPAPGGSKPGCGCPNGGQRSPDTADSPGAGAGDSGEAGRHRPNGHRSATPDRRGSDCGCPVPNHTPDAGASGETGRHCAEMIGVGPIADSVLARYLANPATARYGAVLDGKGLPLWLGRTARYASDAQFLALAVRDRGCVECGADPQVCHAHHLIPHNAPARGPTDLDNLALLCGSCHHELHRQNLTLCHQPDGSWASRPATPQETPPPRPLRPPAPAAPEHHPRRE